MPMEQCAKMSTPQSNMKWCYCCKRWKPKNEFWRNKNKVDGFTTECKICASEKYKAYVSTEGGRENQRQAERRYNASDKGRARHKAYHQTPKGKATNQRAHMKYRSTRHGWEADQRYYYQVYSKKIVRLPRPYNPEHYQAWYHRIQEEAGYFHNVKEFYPGYRFIKALEEAKFVEWEEIKDEH